MIGLAAVGTIALLLVGSSATDDAGEPKSWVNWLKLALGILLLLVAVTSWKTRPADGEGPAMPKWMSAIDSFSPGKAAAVAFILAGVNPKNVC